MKREELMIGDWVIRKGVPEEPMRLYDMKATADIAYFAKDWDKYRGCKIEHTCATEYGIDVMHFND